MKCTHLSYSHYWNGGCMNIHRMYGMLYSRGIQYTKVTVKMTLKHVCFCSVSIWPAGWIWSSTGGLLRRRKLSDMRDRLTLQPNTSTGSTSLALTAPPHLNNRMMYVTWIENMFSVVFQRFLLGIVTTLRELNIYKLSEEVLDRCKKKEKKKRNSNEIWASPDT